MLLDSACVVVDSSTDQLFALCASLPPKLIELFDLLSG